MNASTQRQIDRSLFKGPVVEVVGTLPFYLHIDADQGGVKEPLAPELHAQLANFLVAEVLRYIVREGESSLCDILLQTMSEAKVVRCGLRDVKRSRVETPGDIWAIKDKMTLTFDHGRDEVILTRFADDHFAAIQLIGNHDVWIVRLIDGNDNE